MKIIENAFSNNEKIEYSELGKISGAFCGIYTKCNDGLVSSTCRPKIGGVKTCFDFYSGPYPPKNSEEYNY